MKALIEVSVAGDQRELEPEVLCVLRVVSTTSQPDSTTVSVGGQSSAGTTVQPSVGPCTSHHYQHHRQARRLHQAATLQLQQGTVPHTSPYILHL